MAAEEAQGQACVGPSDRQGGVWWQVRAGQSLSTAPGSSLVSVCQRSIRLSLFFRQSNQCFRRSPLALMPRTTPPAGGKFRGQPGAWGRCSHKPILLEPMPPPPFPSSMSQGWTLHLAHWAFEGGHWSSRHDTLLALKIRAQDPILPLPRTKGGRQKESKRARVALLCAATKPTGIRGHKGSESSPRCGPSLPLHHRLLCDPPGLSLLLSHGAGLGNG